MASEVMVSVICLAYNHEPYIRTALDGFVMQKTDFSFEVLVHDDASTDATAAIIREYEEKYPDIIKPIYQTENQHSQGKAITRSIVLPRAVGRYVAFCEGDDCWTDPTKLQKQVNFLEANPDYSLCVHRTRVHHLAEDKYTVIPSDEQERDFTPEEIIRRGALFQLTSVVMRMDLYRARPDCFAAKGFGDYPLFIYGAICGKCRMLGEVMSLYNHGTAGSWTARVARDPKKCIVHDQRQIDMLKRVDEYYEYRYTEAITYAVNRSQYTIYRLQGDKRRFHDPRFREFAKMEKKLRRHGFARKLLPWAPALKQKLKSIRKGT